MSLIGQADKFYLLTKNLASALFTSYKTKSRHLRNFYVPLWKWGRGPGKGPLVFFINSKGKKSNPGTRLKAAETKLRFDFVRKAVLTPIY